MQLFDLVNDQMAPSAQHIIGINPRRLSPVVHRSVPHPLDLRRPAFRPVLQPLKHMRYPCGVAAKDSRMTIAAGFRVMDGVLICADTEHSSGGILTHDTKLVPIDFGHGKAIFSYSGDNVDLARAAVQKCIARLRRSTPEEVTSHWDIAQIVEGIVDIEYRKHVCANPDPKDSSIYQVLLAAWSPNDGGDGPGLYSTWQGTIQECDSHEAAPTGV